jgi:exodeoxyribonuclease V gamma subunit
MRDAAARALGDRTPPPGPFPEGVALEPEAPEAIDLAELIRFFKSPQRALLERRLRVRFPDEATSLEEREPLEIDPLELWGIRDEILRSRLEGDEDSVEALVARKRAEGSALAHGLDELVVEAQEREIDALREAMISAEVDPSIERVPVEVEVELRGGRRVIVTGEAPAPVDGELVIAIASKSVSAHRLVRAMLEGVCLTHAREPSPVGEIKFFRVGAAKPGRYALPQEPVRWLATMVEIFIEGRARAIPLFSKASHKLAGIAGDLEAARAASKEYFGSGSAEYQGPAEADAPAARVLFPIDPFIHAKSGEPNQDAIDLARAVYAPILEAKR